MAAAAWLMAEAFTRRRRMALPSIVLLLAFVLGLSFAAYQTLDQALPPHVIHEHYTANGQQFSYPRSQHYRWQAALMTLGGAAAAALGAVVHWRRFRVAITIAAAVGALAISLLALVAAITDRTVGSDPVFAPAALVCGLAVFAYAMRWDMADRARTTQRSDIAFWLHLVAAPLIAHPLFYWMGVTRGDSIGAPTVLAVLAVYLAFALVALAVDRRALLVSALAYVLIALAALLRRFGAVQLDVALTALVIGTALLALSAWWHVLRRRLVVALPADLRSRLPPLG